MNKHVYLPRILIIDDVLGRTLPDRRNEDRANFCGEFLLQDVTGDESEKSNSAKILRPIGEAVFCRGQLPVCATPGDNVENDWDSISRLIAEGWESPSRERPLWSLALLDLCFKTGRVTEKSGGAGPNQGIAEGRAGDGEPGGYFGLKVLRSIYEAFPGVPVVILSGQAREEVSREFSFWGGLAFLDRGDPESPKKLEECIWRYGLIPDEESEIEGCSKSLLFQLRLARRCALDNRHVLIRGERGTGKELLAAYIHRQTLKAHASERSPVDDATSAVDAKKRPFVALDSGTLSPHLYGSVLFGHVKGAFTGATSSRTGAIVDADGGDLFLDEIANMPPDVQMGLLRVTQFGIVNPIGASKGTKVDVRIISATSEDIQRNAASEGFRADLLDRLCAAGTIHLPPLASRKSDIPLLVERFVREAEKTIHSRFERKTDPVTLEKLDGYDWPGNVRELRDCVFSAVTNHPDVEHLVPIHILLPESRIRQSREKIRDDEYETVRHAYPGRSSGALDAVVRELTQFDFGSIKPHELKGRLQALQEAYAAFFAFYLDAALNATKDHVSDKIEITPATQLMTGNAKLTTAQAADTIKRMLKLFPSQESLQEFLAAHPSIAKAMEVAERLRGRIRM